MERGLKDYCTSSKGSSLGNGDVRSLPVWLDGLSSWQMVEEKSWQCSVGTVSHTGPVLALPTSNHELAEIAKRFASGLLSFLNIANNDLLQGQRTYLGSY